MLKTCTPSCDSAAGHVLHHIFFVHMFRQVFIGYYLPPVKTSSRCDSSLHGSKRLVSHNKNSRPLISSANKFTQVYCQHGHIKHSPHVVVPLNVLKKLNVSHRVVLFYVGECQGHTFDLFEHNSIYYVFDVYMITWQGKRAASEQDIGPN